MKFAWLCSHESYQPEDLVEQAVAAEEAGFDVVLGSDHFHPWVDDTSAAGLRLVLAGRGGGRRPTTSQLGHLGHLPAVPLPPRRWSRRWPRPPTGCPAAGCCSASAPARRSTSARWASRSPATRERQARMQEALEIMHRLLAGEKLTFHGEYYTTETAQALLAAGAAACRC